MVKRSITIVILGCVRHNIQKQPRSIIFLTVANTLQIKFLNFITDLAYSFFVSFVWTFT